MLAQVGPILATPPASVEMKRAFYRTGLRKRRRNRRGGLKRRLAVRRLKHGARLSGLGRSKAEKRAARAAWVATVEKMVAENLETGLDNIGAGRDVPPLPEPEIGAVEKSPLWEHLEDFQEGAEQQIAEALGYTTPATPEPDRPEPYGQATQAHRAAQRQAVGSGVAAILPYALPLAFLFLK